MGWWVHAAALWSVGPLPLLLDSPPIHAALMLPLAWVPVQVICKTCGTVGEREEAFHHIPLDVKINNNIHDAFSQFVNGETISDYK